MMDDDENIEKNGPVDLVKRVKLENEEPLNEKFTSVHDPSSTESIPLGAFFVRRRRRGRGRYAPFYVHSDFTSRAATTMASSGGSDLLLGHKTVTSATSSAAAVSLKSIRGQFACPNCSLLFSNRDALAMHMMDSVRSQGCSGQQPSSTRPTVRLPSPTAALTTSPAAAARLALRLSNAAFSNIPPPLGVTVSVAGSSSVDQPTSTVRSPGNGINVTTSSSSALFNDPYACRLCGERAVSVDALAMHMLAHEHHEQVFHDTNRTVDETGKHYSSAAAHSKLPAIAPLYFSALDFTSMQHAMNMAMSTLNKTSTNVISTPVDKQLRLTTNSHLAKLTTVPELPPKCHSAPITTMSLPGGVDELPQQSCSNANTPDGSDSARNSLRRCGLSQNLSAIDFLQQNAATISPNEEEDSESVAISSSDRDDGEESRLNNGKLGHESGKVGQVSAEFPFCFVCRHCRIAYEDRTIFCLHMGLHNVNNPWQCNMCGKVCGGRHEFASHSLHF